MPPSRLFALLLIVRPWVALLLVCASSSTVAAETASDEHHAPSTEETPAGASPPRSTRSRAPLGPHAVTGDEATGFAQRAFGPRGQLSLHPNDPVEAGGAFQMRSFVLLFGPVVSALYVDRLWLGADAGGVTYSLSSHLAVGARWELEGNHGPFARLEMRGEMLRTAGWYQSSLRLPGAELGWGIDRGDWIFDAYAHSSPSLTGFLKSPDQRRAVRGTFAGAGMTLGWTNWHLYADASQLFKSRFGSSLWDLRASLCSYFWRTPTMDSATHEPSRSVGPRSTDYKVGFCLDSTTVSTPETARFSEKTDLGLSIMVGGFSRVDRSGHP